MTWPGVLDSALSVRLALTLGHFVWQGLALSLIAALTAALLQRASARARYGTFVVTLLLMAACPPATFLLLPPSGLPAPEATTASRDAVPPEGAVPLSFSSETGADASGPTGTVASADASRSVDPSDASGPLPALVDARVEGPPLIPLGTQPAGAHVGGDRTSTPRAIAWHRYAPYAVLLYVGGVTIMLSRLLLALRGGQRLRRRSQPVDDPRLLAALAGQAKRLKLAFTPAIAVCQRVVVPTVIGVLRPMILLPTSLATGLTTEQVEMLLAHELAHIRRYDHLVNVLQRLIEAALFFHPAVWFVSRRIRIEREHCCDDMVVAAGAESVHYADSLIRMAELGQSSAGLSRLAAAAALGAAGRSSHLHTRVLRLIEGPAHQQVRLAHGTSIALVLVGILTLSGIAQLAVPGSADTTPDRDAKPPLREPMNPRAFVATLSDGSTVELVGIHSNGGTVAEAGVEHPDKVRPGWRPDGSPLADAPYDSLEQGGGLPKGKEDHVPYDFVIRLHGVPQDAEPVWQFTPSAFPYGGGSIYKGDRRLEGFRTRTFAAPPAQLTTTLRLGVPVGGWKTLSAFKNLGYAGTSEYPLFVTGDLPPGVNLEPDSTFLSIIHTITDHQTRVVAVDQNDRAHESATSAVSSSGHMRTIYGGFHRLPWEQIKELRFQVRPYEWVEFRNVSLRPGHQTDVQVQVGPVASPEPATTRPAVETGAPGFSGLVQTGRSPWLSEQEQSIVSETFKTLAAELARLEAEKLQSKAAYENLVGTDRERIPISPETRLLIQQDPRILKLQDRVDELERALQANLKSMDGEKHPTALAQRAEIESLDRKLAGLIAEREAEVREYEIHRAQTRYLNAVQAEMALRERLLEVEAKQRDLDRQHARVNELQSRIRNLESQLGRDVKGRSDEHPDVVRMRQQLDTLKEQLRQVSIERADAPAASRDLEPSDETATGAGVPIPSKIPTLRRAWTSQPRRTEARRPLTASEDKTIRELGQRAADGDDEALDELIRLLDSSDPSVRQAAILSLRDLAHNGGLRAQEALEEREIALTPLRADAAEFGGRNHAGFVYLAGQIARPGAYTLSSEQELTISRLIIAGGGYSGASLTGSGWVHVRRRDDGKEKLLGPWRLDDIVDGKQPDISLMPNDVVQVSNSRPSTELPPGERRR